MLEIIKPFDAASPAAVKLKFDLYEDEIENPASDRMPADFASYLLSSSPPAFELNYSFKDPFGLSRPRVVKSTRPQRVVRPFHKSGSLPDLRSAPPPEDTVSRTHSDEEFQDHEDVVGDIRKKDKPKVPSLGKKRVSFADDCGRNLCQIRILTESSDTPPIIRPPAHVLNSLTNGCSAGVTHASPLMLNFPQPASNYLAFREKIEKDCVSLENVILRDYTLIGTIKVKNVSFEKSVRVRCTFDSWETHTDFAATFVPNAQNVYDTFAFEIKVLPTFNVRKKVQFCICYSVEGAEYWDSNDGRNYEVVSADWKEDGRCSSHNTTIGAVYDLNSSTDWTQFSGWDNMDSSCPYW